MKSMQVILAAFILASFSSRADWPMYQGSQTLSGSSDVALPDTPERLWRIDLGSPLKGNPIIYSNLIYALPESGRLSALSMAGELVWSRDLNAEHMFSAPPLAISGTIVAASSQGHVYAVEADSGEVRWSYQFGEEILGTPNWFEAEGEYRVVILGRKSGRIKVLSLSDGQTVLEISGRARCDGAPSIIGDQVVFGDCNAEVYFYSLSSGELLGLTKLGGRGQIAGGVSIDGDSAFAGSHGGSVYRIALKSREIVWSFDETDGPVYSTPALTGELVVFASDRGTLYCLEKSDGTTRWKREIDGAPRSVTLARNRAIVSASGVVSVYDLSSGAELWRREISDEATAAALIENMLVIGTDCGNLWAFGKDSAEDNIER